MIMEERHKCKLCSRSFTNGRALGGHMKAHLATLPLPLPLPPKTASFTCASFSCSSSSSSDSEHEHEHDEETLKQEQQESLIYGLRENPKKSFRVADPEFSPNFDTASVVQDRESETESKNPTRQRSKRKSSSMLRLRLSFVSEPEPVSSVSDTSPEEDVAMCLMMLSRDTWHVPTNALPPHTSNRRCTGSQIKKLRGKHLCDNCRKAFRSSRALATHRSICQKNNNHNHNHNHKVFQCPFCYKVFGSGQALGGHKRSHLIASSSSVLNDSVKLKQSIIDLNLPAPPEDDDLSVVSDA